MDPASRMAGVGDSRIRQIVREADDEDLNLCWGQPDLPSPDHVREAAADAIARGEADAYTDHRGIRPLREAIADFVDYELAPEEVIVTAGTMEALYASLLAYVDPGDEVLLPDPCFLSYESQVRLVGGRPRTVAVDPETNRLDPAAVAEAVTDDTAAVVVNSPHNPTAEVLAPDEARALAELADDEDFLLVSDEVYDRVVYDIEHVSPARFGDNVAVVNAVSKTFSMTGWRVGYVAAPGLVEPVRRAHQNVTLHATAAAQHAAVAAFEGPVEPLDAMIDTYRERRDLVVDGLADLGLPCRTPQGTFYAYPEVPAGFVEACAERGLLVLNGDAFGPAGAGHVRISYAGTDVDDLARALDVMAAALADCR